MKSAWILLFALIACSSVIAQWQNCQANQLFTEFTVFPNPVQVGQNVFVRAVIEPNEQISDGTVLFRVFRNASDPKEAIISIPGISICNMTEEVQCPILPGQHIYTWQFLVPEIPEGAYLFRYDFDLRFSQACLLFDLTIQPNSSTNATAYVSHYEAVLDGTANFQTKNVLNRTWGDQVQVGPVGYFPKSIGSGFNYGIFSSVTGSGDLIPEGGLTTANYVWGLFGSLKSISIGNTSVQHNYTGTFYVGYFPDYLPSSAANLNTSLLEGEFILSWTYYDPDYSRGYIDGYITIASTASMPSSWGFPLLFGRLDSVVVTDTNGRLKAQGNAILCLAGGTGCEATPPPNSVTTGSGGDKFSNTELGAVIGAILGFAFLVIVLVAFLTYMKNKRESEEEDGVFAVARKPEYGSALILDDIIQETSGKNRDLRPMLDPRRRMDAQDSLSEDDDLGYAAPDDDFSNSIASRSVSVSNSRSQSRKQPKRTGRGRSPRERTTEAEDSQDEDESRSRSPASRSPAARRRGRSTSRSTSRSPVPKRGRSRSFDSDRNADRRSDRSAERSVEDAGSSASRVSDNSEDDEE